MSAPAATPDATAAAQGGFSARTVLILILVAVFSFAGVMVLSAYAPDLQRGDNGGGHALSRSAIGFAAAPKLLAATGRTVVMSRGPLGESASEGLLILTPHQMHDAEALTDISYEGIRLVVLPKWFVGPHPRKSGWVQGRGLLPPDVAARPLSDRSARLSRRPGSARPRLLLPDGTPFAAPGSISRLQTLSGDGWISVVVDETGEPVLARHHRTGLYVLADPDLLNTHGLKDASTARAAVAIVDLIRDGDGPIIFDLTLHGLARSRNLLKLMLEPPLLGATLCLLAAALLVAFQAAVRFGPAKEGGRAIALGKRALADNTAGLIRLARREHRMAAPYAALVRADVARAVAAPRNLGGDDLDAFLDRLGERLGASRPYTALAAEARAARNAGDLIRVARNLRRWKLEMTRARQ